MDRKNASVQDSNDKGTIDQQQEPQQNIDESKQIVKASDSLATQQQIVPVFKEDF